MFTEGLQGKHIVVIGGSSGIGLATAQLAHQAGAAVTLTSRDGDRARAVAQGIGPAVRSAALDLGRAAQIDALFQGGPAPDHVYIAAGATRLGGFLDAPLDEQLGPLHDRQLGSIRVVRAGAPHLRPGGSVTFTGGISTDRPVPGAWVSGVGTATAEQLARVLALELAPLRFNAVSPGWTDTPMWDPILGENKAAVLAGVAEKLPVRRIATARDVAWAVLFLMTSSAITGEVLHVDGGGRLV